jgi:hypothetical protein
MMKQGPAAICEEGCGPLHVAVRVWTLFLEEQLKVPRAIRKGQIVSIENARDRLLGHVSGEVDAIDQLILAVAPQGTDSLLRGAVGPLGMTAVITRSYDEKGAVYWPVHYRHTDDIVVHIDPERTPQDQDLDVSLSSSSVDYLTDDSPRGAAVKRIKSACNSLAVARWL